MVELTIKFNYLCVFMYVLLCTNLSICNLINYTMWRLINRKSNLAQKLPPKDHLKSSLS